MKDMNIPARTNAARSAFLILGWLCLATAATVFGVILYGSLGLGLKPGEHALLGSALFGPLGGAIILLAAILGIAGLVTARSIIRGKPWGRIAGIILGIAVLPLVPLGTGLGIIALPGFFGAEARAWFGRRS
jgi:hypothetical protein